MATADGLAEGAKYRISGFSAAGAAIYKCFTRVLPGLDTWVVVVP